MRSNEFINEMAAPRESDRSKVYFHGTKTLDQAKLIMQNGLDPAATILKYGNRNPIARPVAGSVYITPSLPYAMIYALGGDMFGSSYGRIEQDIEKFGEYGFVFVIDNASLADIGPDEDSVGEIAQNAITGKIAFNELKYLAHRYLTPLQMKKISGDYVEYSTLIQVGKKLVKVMPDSVKLQCIDHGAHIAHLGRLMTKECWAFSRHDVQAIKRDGSNFFDHAKKV